ncbi:MAG: peptidoglycan DD-metalloendopeptidase family protein [Bacillota bacterium]|nr:peptidoglycan DD-metalloendopeptidase family protein [Bacillota bacterium]
MKKARGISRVGALIMSIALLCSIFIYVFYAPNAYEIYVNGSAVACVKDLSNANYATNKIFTEIHERFTGLNIREDAEYRSIIAESSALSSLKDIRGNILNALDIKVKGVEMEIDGVRAAILADASEGEEIIGRVSTYYMNNLNLEDKKFTAVRNSIKYIPVEVPVSAVDEIGDAAQRLIGNNNIGAAPALKIEYSGVKKEKQAVAYSQTVTLTEELTSNASKIVNKGQDGEKEVESLVSYINGEAKSSNVISEKITKEPQNEVVLKGRDSYSPGIVGMVLPSRGTVSSNFGMRWGKMHEGIDIAAKMGDPIYASIDGKVVYSGWIEGYGYAVKIQHDNNLETLYGHCSKLIANVGDMVKKGQLIANVGSTGNSTGPHLHFEVRIDGKAVNPYPYIYTK